MEKEEILEASKKENKNKDVYEIQVESKGATYAGLSMLILALIFYTYEIFSGKGSNPAFYSIITIYNAVLFGYKAIKLDKRKGLYVFTSVVWGILTIMLILDYFKVI